MPASFDHVVVPCKDPEASSAFMARILDAPPARQTKGYPDLGVLPFWVFTLGTVCVDFCTYDPDTIRRGHYGYLVDDATFDAARKRLEDEGIEYGGGSTPNGFTNPKGVTNYSDGGRALYFYDVDGHNIELTTKSEHTNMNYFDD